MVQEIETVLNFFFVGNSAPDFVAHVLNMDSVSALLEDILVFVEASYLLA